MYLTKSAAERDLNISEAAILLCGFVLAWGAIGEYLEEHEKLPRWMAWSKLVFIGMVVFGLVGEFVFDAGVFVFSKKLQEIEGAEIAALDQKARRASREAESAVTRSGVAVSQSEAATREADLAKGASSTAIKLARGAREEADTFEADIKSAKLQSGEAKTLASEAKALLDDVHKLAAEAQQRARAAQTTTLQLQRESAPRRLTEEQKVELVRLLSLVPNFTVRFLPLRSSSKEVADFTDDLMDVFVRMGKLSPGSDNRTLGKAIGGSDARGVAVGCLSREQCPPALKHICQFIGGLGVRLLARVSARGSQGPCGNRHPYWW
jgi:hypothetical protein